MQLELKEAAKKFCDTLLSADGKSVVIIDQTRLPNHLEYLTLRKPEDFYDAIKKLQVRG